MTFDPLELNDLANALMMVTETEATGLFLQAHSGLFVYQWKERRRLDIEEMPMPLPRKKAIFPSDCQLEISYLSLQFEPGDEAHFPLLADYQIRVEGWIIADKAVFELQDHWRIDTHTFDRELDDPQGNATKKKGKGDGPEGEPIEPHAIYHFQRGGHAQDRFASVPQFIPGSGVSIEGELRGLFQSPGPRIPSLPLDPILAIDFCVGQADGYVWKRLRNIPEYFSLIEQAQKRTWHPFFTSLSDPGFRRRWLGPFCL